MKDSKQFSPRVQKLLSNCSPSFRNNIIPVLSEVLSLSEETNLQYKHIPNQSFRQCILCIKAMTSKPSYVLIITNTFIEAKNIFQQCTQIGQPNQDGVFLVGSDISIKKDRESAKENVLIGDIERIIYLIEHQYLKVFRINSVLFLDVSQILENKKQNKLKQLFGLLPKQTNKILLHSKQFSLQAQDILQDL